MTIDEYEAEAIEDLKFDVSDFQGYAKSLGMKRIKWSKYLFEEETLLSVAEDKLRELYRDKFHFYMYKYDEVKLEKKNVETYIKGDPEYRSAEQIVSKQNSKMKFVGEIINALDRQSFACSNILKHLIWPGKFEFPQAFDTGIRLFHVLDFDVK